jgi:hypothetical protein
MIVAVLIVAALALALAALALFVAIGARSKALDALQRTARHQKEHRAAKEGTGLPRHRASPEPVTEQLAAQPRVPAGSTRAEPDAPIPARYAKLRQNRDDSDAAVDTGDLPATEVHVAMPRRPGSMPNLTEPVPHLPALPPPGQIGHSR